MRINFDRICELAGTSSKGSTNRKYTRRPLNESSGPLGKIDLKEEDEADEGVYEEDEADEGVYENMYEEDEVDEMDLNEDEDELVEVDVAELMSEVRRAKRLMKENRRRSRRRQLAESRRKEDHLKRIIEVENVLSEIDERDSSWMYGKRQPRHSRRGYTNQGRTLPGIGFKNNW
jgi:hypothetical protein